MKKIIIFAIVHLLITISIFAQPPEKMSYQAIIRNNSDRLVTEANIGVQISVLHGSAGGTAVYVEKHFTTTNINGLVILEIGNGTVISGNFDVIDWENGPYFLKTQTDLNGGENYTITGTSQLLSVPYAFHAKTAKNIPVGTQAGEMQYWNGTQWTTVAAGAEGQVLGFVGGVPTWITLAGPTDIRNPTTGKVWMDRNLGASQVATSSIDADAYGDLFQWGRAADGHQSRASEITPTMSTSDTPGHGKFIINLYTPWDWRNPQNDNLWQGLNGTNNPCPNGYRVPTDAEWEAERLSWSSNNTTGAFASPLKLPAAGWRNYADGWFRNVGSEGIYWSSTVRTIRSRILYFVHSDAFIDQAQRNEGYSVRCIKD